jgi:1-pyrroline-5-carboxylate dehydrogenase
MFQVPSPVNEPVLSYAPGSKERLALDAEVKRLLDNATDVPLHIGGETIRTGETKPFTCPHAHSTKLGQNALAGEEHVKRALTAALDARAGWAAMDFHARAAVFLRAAELLAGPWRQRLNAATALNQSKTAHQAEIDAACELIDFFRFNAHFAEKLAREQPLSVRGIWNKSELRPLDGFVYAVTPFNFTSIAGNLPTAPALMGNTVIWKPSQLSPLSAHFIMELLTEAGLPPGVVNLVYGKSDMITRVVLDSPDFAGFHFTGSTAVMQGLWRSISDNLGKYRTYPRIVGETGG